MQNVLTAHINWSTNMDNKVYAPTLNMPSFWNKIIKILYGLFASRMIA